MLDSVNPFNDLISVPDIGALFGNQDDYDAAYAIGAAGGTAIVLTASVFGPGLVQCGSWGQKALIAYEGADIVGGLATAGKSISSGNFGLSDAVNIAGAVLSVGGLKNALGACFVGDTLVVVPDHMNFQSEVAGLASDPERDSEWNFSTMLLAAISVPVGLTGFGLLEKKKKKQQPFAKLDHLFAENDFHELWHPQSDVPRNGRSQYFPVNRGSQTELLSNQELSFAKIKEPQHQLRKQTEMHRPHLQNNVVQKQNRSHLAGGISVVGLLCLLGTFLVSGSLFWLAAPKAEPKTPVVASATVPLTHKRIQDIQPGQWVKADNPVEEDDTEFGKHVDPATWKLLKLKAPKLDGTLANVSLLRPNHWLTQQSATVGGTVYISVPECGIDGNATVLSIEACPPIAANPGPGFQVVTGTFQHQAAKILDIAVEGESKPISTTPNHPFWSVDRQEFVRADSLTVGERLQSLNGITTVMKISPRGPPEPVYNLEVQVKHTYYVADSGVLVHNGKNCGVGESVYQHTDDAGNVNYIGITNNLKTRSGAHRLDASKTGTTMKPITNKLTHDQARTIEAKLIRQRLRAARTKGLINGFEPVAEQLKKAGLLNKNRGRDPSRWIDVDPKDFLKELGESFNIRTLGGN
ncbi:polymorphic toxin-type HINT domain-containing protein [Gimesia aquarii]|uniref:Uncharacterized protein n=1 Tax=Gimesia aquarii TaxID=2527964 RepID=A0A517WSD1_9PLAN|nr:polymorphic toxin-type HINT domain-containing protein [Gimesia aquarii]QDU08161.1 hypothetical protein V202x_15250 [Gimesia aquarii]